MAAGLRSKGVFEARMASTAVLKPFFALFFEAKSHCKPLPSQFVSQKRPMP
jgi:hypothetical protein